MKSEIKRVKDNVTYGEFSVYSYSGIYAIKNVHTNKMYIGSSNNIGNRIAKHFSELRFNRHTNKLLQIDYNNLGYIGFEILVLEKTTNLLEKEKEYQLQIGIDDLYNEIISGNYINPKLSVIRSKTDKSSHKTEEYRQKMSKLKTKYKVAKYDKKGNFIEIFESIESIINTNPTYKVNVIRGVCNGSKSSYDGFLWRYVDENNNMIKNYRDN